MADEPQSEWAAYAEEHGDGGALIGANAKAVLESLISDRNEAELAVEEANEALDSAKSRLKSINETLIPEAFSDMGLAMAGL